MSLDIQPIKQSIPRYFFHLRKHKLFRSIFSHKPFLHVGLLFMAYVQLKRIGFDFNVIRRMGGRLIQLHKRINAIVVEFDKVLTNGQKNLLQSVLGVQIEEVQTIHALNDKSVIQTHIINARSKNDTFGKGITVAVVDTGINDQHPDLKGQVINRKDFTGETVKSSWFDFIFFWKKQESVGLDPVGHGTHCAGTIAGLGEVYGGVAPQAKLMDVRVLRSNGSGTTDSIVKALSWLSTQKVDIISMSLGGPGNPNDAISKEVDHLAEQGILVVVAAGNSGPNKETIGSPGTARMALTVGAVDPNNKITSYSSRGPVKFNNEILNKPDIVAPGGGIVRKNSCAYGNGITSVKSLNVNKGVCTLNTNGKLYEKMSGTSMATPHVAGICALFLEAMKNKVQMNPTLFIKELLRKSASSLGYVKDTQGMGLINAEKAIDLINQINNG